MPVYSLDWNSLLGMYCTCSGMYTLMEVNVHYVPSEIWCCDNAVWRTFGYNVSCL